MIRILLETLCCDGTEFFVLVESKVVKLQLRYVASDWRGYALRHHLSAIVFTSGFIFIAFFALYVVGSRYLIESVAPSFRLVLLVFLFGAPLVSTLISLANVERFARRKGRWLVTLVADESGVSYSEEHRSAKFDWQAYKRGIEHNDHFAFTSATGGLLVPKRCFTSTEQLADFRDLAKRGLNGKFRVA